VIQEAGADEFAGVRVIDAVVLVVTSRNEAMLHSPVTLDVEGTCENAIPDLVQPGSALFTALARTTLMCHTCLSPSRQPSWMQTDSNVETDTQGRHTRTIIETDDKNMNWQSQKPEGK
jgi:hypothetical protein